MRAFGKEMQIEIRQQFTEGIDVLDFLNRVRPMYAEKIRCIAWHQAAEETFKFRVRCPLRQQPAVLRTAYFQGKCARIKGSHRAPMRGLMRSKDRERIVHSSLKQCFQRMPIRLGADIVHHVHGSALRKRSMAAANARMGNVTDLPSLSASWSACPACSRAKATVRSCSSLARGAPRPSP